MWHQDLLSVRGVHDRERAIAGLPWRLIELLRLALAEVHDRSIGCEGGCSTECRHPDGSLDCGRTTQSVHLRSHLVLLVENGGEAKGISELKSDIQQRLHPSPRC